jgi:hypothetical protein
MAGPKPAAAAERRRKRPSPRKTPKTQPPQQPKQPSTPRPPRDPFVPGPNAGAGRASGADLADGLRALLSAIETEVRAVSELSERIDAAVVALNRAREEQAERLVMLDALRASVDDANLRSFLAKAIRPRRPRVREVIPARLSQDS